MCCLNGYYGQIQNVRILKEPFRVSILPLTTLTPDQNLTVTASCDSWAANKYPDLIISLNRYCQVLDSKVKEGFRGHLVLVNCLSIQRDLVSECPLPPTYGIVFCTVNLHLPLYHLHPPALILSSVCGMTDSSRVWRQPVLPKQFLQEEQPHFLIIMA